MPPKTPKAGTKDVSLMTANLCKIHKQSYSMICLHGNCHSCYTLICAKCKKQKHYQHPNRVISLKDFYDMLTSNKMDFIENSLGFSLINIKNKLIYVSNFRVFILQKQSMLMQNARIIHGIIFKILQQKSVIKGFLQNMSQDTQNKNTNLLVSSLNQLKKYIAFNPIQNVMRINSQKVGVLKVQLQKYCEATQIVINDIRQYLVKIVQVMIQEQIEQDYIEFQQHEDVDQKVFNIGIKRLNQAQINQKQPKYKVQQLQGFFQSLLNLEVQKHQQHIENDVQKLQQEIRFKSQIVRNIRQRSQSKRQNKEILQDYVKQSDISQRKKSDSVDESVSISISQSNNRSMEGQKDFLKVSVTSPKNKNLKNQPKAGGKNFIGNIKSPKTPKIRSITDKGNITPKSPNNANKVSGFNAGNKRSPKSNTKNTNQTSKSQIKIQQREQKPQSCKFSQNDQKLQSQGSTDFAFQRIDQSEQEQLLNTQTNFNNPASFNKKAKKQSKFEKQQSLLLDNQQKQAQKIKELEQKIKNFKQKIMVLSSELQHKIDQINLIQNNFKRENIQMKEQINRYETQLKDALQKIKQDSEILQKFQNQKKQRKEVQKIEQKTKIQQKNFMISSLDQTSHNKKNLQQKKQFQGKIQKLEKELKIKQESFKKQHAQNLNNGKQMQTIKKKNEDLSKKNEDLSKKNEDLIKKSDNIVKQSQQNAKKVDELNKKLEQENKKAIQTKKKHQQQLNTKIQQLNKQKTWMEKRSQQVRSKLQQSSNTINCLQQKISLLQSQSIKASKSQIQQHNSKKQKQILQQLFLRQKQQLQSQIHTLQCQCQEYKLNVKDNQHVILEMEKTIQEMEEIIKEKDCLISQNQAMVNENQAIIDQNERLNNQKKEIIENLEKQLKQLNQKTNLNEATQRQNQSSIFQKDIIIQSKDFTIKQNIEKLAVYQNKISQFQTSLKQKDQLILRNEDLFRDNENQIKEKQKQLAEKQKQINNLLNQLSKSQQNIKQLENKYIQKSKTIDQLQELAQQRESQKIWFKDEEIKNLELKLKQINSQSKNLNSLNRQLQDSLSLSKSSTNLNQSQNQSLTKKVSTLLQQNTALIVKLQKTQDSLLKQKQSEYQSQKQHQKQKLQLLQQYQHIKKMYEEEKLRNQQNTKLDVKNYIPLIKYKELKEWYQIAMRKNQQMREQIVALRDQKKKIIEEYEGKLKQINQENIFLLQKTKINFNSATPDQLKKGSIVNRQSIKTNSNENLPQPSIIIGKYSEIRSILEIITSDMHLLEQKVKQNTVIEKVYLKELDRKRTENRKLRQEIQQYRTRERKLGGVRTDRYYQKASNSKNKNDKKQYKVYYATGFAGSESRISSGGSNVTQSNNNTIFQDNFQPNQCKSSLSQNSNKI